MTKEVKDAILKYLEIRKTMQPKNKKDEDALFLSNENKRIHTCTIRKFVKIAYKKLGIDNKKYAVHTLRHTCATLLIKGGNDVKIVQKILGHSSVNTTKIYAHIYNKDIEEALFRKHPLAHFKIKDAIEFASVAI